MFGVRTRGSEDGEYSWVHAWFPLERWIGRQEYVARFYAERWGDMGRCGEVWGDMGRYEESWGELGRAGES